MSIFDRLFKRGSSGDEIEHIAVILFRHNEGTGFVCAVNRTRKSIDIIDERAFTYSNAWENLVYDVDELLYNFEVTHDIKLNKAMFFVYSHLVDPVTGELKEPYVTSFKDVLAENKLESLGYIELEESLAMAYSQTEQSPLNAVLVEVDTSSVSVFVYKGGQKSFAQSIAKTEDLVADLEELFSRTEKGMLLPARILMYDSPSVESESHTILTHHWPEKLFVQLPRVDVVRESELKQAIVYGVTEDLFGAGAVRALPATSAAASAAPGVHVPVIDGVSTVAAATATTAGASPVPVTSAAASLEEPASPLNSEDTRSAGSENEMGFVIGEDIRDTENAGSEEFESQTIMPTPSQHSPVPVVPQQSPADMSIDPAQTTHASPSEPRFGSLFATIQGKLMGLQNVFSTGGSRKGMYAAGIVLVGIVIIIASLYAFLFNFHKATLTVLYRSDPIESTLTVTDEDQFEQFTETFTVTAEVPATGSQDIGDKATGTVTIFGASESDRTFEAGTEMTTADGHVFVLDEDVVVEAASISITEDGDVLASTTKVDAPATAQEIGPASNMKADTKLTFDGLSSTTYFARAKGAFTGGSSETVTTVARADVAKADAEIEKKLTEESKAQLASISAKGTVVDDLTLINTKEQTYSHEVSEETKALEVRATATVTFYAYDDSALTKQAVEELEQDVPDGFELHEKNITYEVASAERDEDTDAISMEVDVTALPAPMIDVKALARDVAGSSINTIRPILQDKHKASGFEADVHSPLPLLRSRLPWFSQNIEVVLKPAKQ